MTPNPKTIDDTLRSIEEASATHPTRLLAKQAIAAHYGRSEASGPTFRVNVHDIHGAPVLDVNATITGSQPGHAPNVSEQRRRGLLRRLLGWR